MNGDTIVAAAGTFTEDVDVTKSLTIEGAEAGVDPGAAGWGMAPVSEILGVGVNAPVTIASGVNNVTVSGFDIESPAAGSGALNAGIFINGSSGITIEDDVLQNNTVGVAIADAGGTITHDLIQNNNAPGAGGGNGVEFFGGSTGVWTISHNHFTGNDSADVLIATGGPTVSHVTIENNTLTNSGGIDLFNTDGALVFENSASAMQGPAVYLGGADSHVEISQNDLSNNPGQAAVMIDNSFGVGPNTTGITIHNNFLDHNAFGVDVTAGSLTGSMTVVDNHIESNATAGLENDSTATVNADFNWWGDASGPTNSSNPSGTGNTVNDPHSNVTFSPWLTSGDDTQDGRADGFQPGTGAAVSINGSSTGTEGATYTLNLSPSSDITSWDINWGDGTMAMPDIEHVTGSPASVTHVYAEEGSYTISAVAHTSSGDANSNTVSVTVGDATLTENSFTPPVATEGAPFSGTVFNFSDADPNGTASDYTAVVVLGDGNTVTLTSTASADGQIVADGSGGFNVNLSHTYLEELSAQTFSVTVYDNGDGRLITDPSNSVVSASTSHFTVADAPLTAGALTPPVATEGAQFTNVQLFHFTDADPNGEASDYTATITWGDGSTSVVTSDPSADGQIVANGGGFDVLGSHTYLEEATGLHFSVSVTDHSTYSNGFETGDTGTSDWTHFDDAMGDTTQGGGITVVSSGTGQLPPAPASGSNFAVVTNTPDTYAAGYGAGGYTFFGGPQKTYTGPFGQSMAIYINTAWAAPANPGVPAFWLDMTPDHADPNNFGAEHNFRFYVDGSGVIKVTADSGDPGTPIAAISQSGWYTFEMTYRKGATATDPVLTDLNIYDATNTLIGSQNDVPATSPGGPFLSSDLTGHGYAWLTVWQDGFANNQLAIDNMNTEVFPISASATINVADAALHAVTLTPPAATEGAPFSGTVFHFTDDDPHGTASDYTAVVTLGDGNTVTLTSTASADGQIVANGGGFDVQLSHTYAEELTAATFAVTVYDNGDGRTIADPTDSTTTASTTFNVGDASLTGSSAATAGGTEGIANSSVLSGATFTDANPGDNTADFTATIHWGDSQTSTGTVSYDSMTATYTVAGTHTYAEEGAYSISIDVVDDGGSTATITGTATVGDATLTENSFTPPAATEGAPFGGTVFNFSDADPNADVTDYTAVVVLGDGNTVTLTSTASADGQIVPDGSGGFNVNLSHTYLEELSAQTFSVTVYDNGDGRLVTDPSNSVVSASTSHFTVADAPLTAGALTPPVATEGAQFTNVQLFHFTDADPNGEASDYTATITWGDGSTSVVTSDPSADGQIVANGGGFDVLGSHTYLEEATGLHFSVSVTDHSTYSNGFETGDTGTSDWTHFDDAMGDTTQGGGITVVSSGTGQLPPAPASGSNFAVVTNTPDTYAAGYGAGGYTFFGGPQKTYTGPFGQSMAIYINTDWLAPANPSVPAFWLDMTPNHNDPSNFGAEHNFRFYVDGSGTIKVTADGGDPGTQAIAAISQSGWYTFEMTYRKGATATDPVLTDLNVYNSADALVGSKTDVPATSPGGPFLSSDLTGHGYAWLTVWQDGFANNQLAIDNMNTEVFPISASATINVADAALHAVTLTPPAATEGAPFSGSVFHFTDDDLNGTASDYTAVVTLGDGNTVTLTSTASADGQIVANGGGFDVQLSHTYAEELTAATFAVTVYDNGDGRTIADPTDSTTTASTTFNVGDASLTGSSAATAGGTEGIANSSVLSGATFTDANPGDHTADFTATIHWGDSQTSTGTVSYDSMTATYTVAGTHSYAEEGSYNISIAVVDDGGSTATITGTAVVSEGMLSFTAGTNFSAVEGNNSGTQTVASFSDTGLEPATAYAATIHWGDGNDSAGVVAQTSPGHFTVTGDHAYAEDGSYNISVTITDDVTHVSSSGTTAVATVNEGVITLSNGTSFNAVEGLPTGTQTVANFTDTGLEPASAYSAVIHWSTGQNTPGVVSQTSPGHFAVTGSTTYAEDGSYNISVTITDDGHDTTAFTDTASVSEGLISFTAGTPFTAVETFDSGTQTVANFSDTGLEPASSYSAAIHWGDGNDSTGTVNQTSPGHFAVTGSHTYAMPGTYNISVTINDDSVPTTSGTTDTATVVDRLTVINTNDSGPGSLRQVITYANTLPGTSHTITFAIPAGPQTIQLLSSLPASTVLLVTQLDATQNVNVVSPTGGGQDNFSALTKVGGGSLTLSGANNLTGNLVVNAGTLRFNDTVAPTLAPGITATVAGSATLDLSGFVSAFTAGTSRVSITNNSSATNGILISGTNQAVGNVDGTGNLAVDAGSDLTANHIVENALVIGGTAGSPGMVTIAPSDALGNSLAAAGGGGSSAATRPLIATQAPAAPLVFATGTLSVSAAPFAADRATIVMASSDSTVATAGTPVVASSENPPQSTAAMGSSPAASAEGRLTSFGQFDAIVAASYPVGPTTAAENQANAIDAHAFSPLGNNRSLDRDAVAALFDDADVFKWLADSRQSRSSSHEVVDSLTTDALSDDLLSTIGQQWHG